MPGIARATIKTIDCRKYLVAGVLAGPLPGVGAENEPFAFCVCVTRPRR